MIAVGLIASFLPGVAAAQDLSTVEKGDTLTATWNPPEYDMPEGARVLVRPDITVNGAVVPIDSHFIKGKAVISIPPAEPVV